MRDWRKAKSKHRVAFEVMSLTWWWSQGPSSRHGRGADCLDRGVRGSHARVTRTSIQISIFSCLCLGNLNVVQNTLCDS